VNPRRDFFLPAIVLDPVSPLPRDQQLCRQIASAIRAGAPRGARLPSTRALARILGVSRNTVLAAYDDLVADGWIAGRPGGGMVIARGEDRGLALLDPARVLREAQYPARTVCIGDQDDTPLYLTY
jgi:DNA-binding GntR family transcriptional regulator